MLSSSGYGGGGGFGKLRGRMRRLKKARILRRRGRPFEYNNEEEGDEEELRDMYRELGVSPPVRNVRYTSSHPLIRELQIRKRAVICVTVAILLFSILIGTLTTRKGREEVIKVEDKLHDYLQNTNNNAENAKTDGSEVLNEAQRESEEYKKVTELYMPSWYTREEGEEGGWQGQSYDEGILFCAGMGRILCPYEGECVRKRYIDYTCCEFSRLLRFVSKLTKKNVFLCLSCVYNIGL